MQRARYVVGVLLATTLVAHATVTQVDGTILPVTNNLQNALDTYETPAGTLNAIVDAHELPQIFKPRLASAVVFLDIREGAGFENSFGWYNVGDDVSTAAGRTANLHPVMGCNVPMVSGAGDASHHSGNPAFYVQNAEEGSTVSVDFNQEKAAGRYKGGFIGFYLITPEDPASPGNRLSGPTFNCGDFKEDGSGHSLFGRIYFTQKDLNNDGDFVHHLVYPAKNAADRFYFGYEDLFRGGDNDFEDMAMRIDGLTPPCVPSTEVCDGIDNDCDGLIDSADPDLQGVGDVCQCDGVAEACDNGPRQGVCQVGVTACTAGAITCHGTGTPSAEICDGKDNNCNGAIDDNPSGTGAACDGTDADLCKEGVVVCSAGALVCNDTTGNSVELCDGVDNDCDGRTDEGDPGGGGACGSTIGACTAGVYHCVGGALQCTGAGTGGPEVCNNIDDDCDGVVDDNPTDVGMVCGASNVGACKLGHTVCSSGSLTCAGEVKPSPETCNNIDDDCDGKTDETPVDAGQPCGSSIGACKPGVYACTGGALACVGATGPVAEQCNGIDDDCDGIVDEDVPGEGASCGAGHGCQDGMTKCIAGSIQCVGGATGGTEICNGVDDDCDGIVDEGPLCNGGVCDNGQCAAPCLPGEFPCPSGKVCDAHGYCVDDPCAGVNCPTSVNGALQSCVGGICQDTCLTTQCTAPAVCRPSDAACVPDNCNFLPDKCGATQLCDNGTCVDNPCNGVQCPSDQFCRAGACHGSCANVACKGGEVCQDGACVPNGCGKDCGALVCNPNSGECVAPGCAGVVCPAHMVCDPATGACGADLCQGVTCPTGQTCAFGQCGLPGAGGDHHVTVGGGGCAAAGGDSSLAFALAVVGLFVLRRRKKLLGVAALALTTGCHVNEYCLDCEAPGDGGVLGGDATDGGGSGSGSGSSCDPNQSHPEKCNHADDDCDGKVDEDFDTQTDVHNCGACGNACDKAGAQTACQAGQCVIVKCFNGYSDRDGDITGPYDQSDGCEYMCFDSNGGVEACDGIDNNCNGTVDEGFDTQHDVHNCGECNHVCQFFQVPNPTCAAGACAFDPATDCAPGYLDINGLQADGCEYQCTPSNGGVERCDLVDNDCDGKVDETTDTQTDVTNCGRCGLACAFPHATPHCAMGGCTFDPATDCAAGFHDIDHDPGNGCEYQCTPTNGGIEICDGKDNDCNGIADDDTMDSGSACASTGTPKGACVANGVTTCSAGHLVCAGATEPAPETCNNIDDDCDGVKDDGVAQSCYTGAAGTNGIGACHGGTATCAAGAFGACSGQVTPAPETCNGADDDCDGTIDNGPGGAAITQSCYTGAAGTAGVGTCKAGTRTCQFGAFGGCTGEVDPKTDVCGDNLDTDCDGKNDTAEGCLVAESEFRVDGNDAAAGANGTAAGANHSYDLVLAHGSSGRVYAAWAENPGKIFFRRSTDGGATWGTILSVVGSSAVKPQLAVAPGTNDRVVLAYQTVSSGVRDIHVIISTNGGTSFGSASAALDGSGDSFHHAIAISGSNCVIAWEKLDTATLNRDIQSRTSTNGCGTFNAETTINVGSGTTRFAGRPQVAITAAGRFVWAWREQRGNSTRDVFAASAPDAATAPTADVALDTDATADGDFPVIGGNGENVFLTWQDVSTATNGGSDVMFARSTDGGKTWSTAQVIDDPAAEVSSSFTPALAVDPATNTVALAWEDRREGSQIYTSVSTDNGATFKAPVRASNETGAGIAGATSVPQLASAGGGILAVVYQNQQAGAKVHSFLATSIDSGVSWTYTHVQLDTGTGDALAPQVTSTVRATKPGFVAGWTDFRSGTHVNGDIYATSSHQ